MTWVYVDASSAILLYRAGLFEQTARDFSLVLAGAVYKEINRDNYPGARLFRKMAESRKLSIVHEEPDTPDIIGLTEFSALDRGERKTIALYLAPTYPGSTEKTSAFVLMDDGQGARFCARHHIPFINALLVPKIFWYSGLMDQTTAEQKMEKLTELGRYSRRIILKARQLTREDLAFFTDREGQG